MPRPPSPGSRQVPPAAVPLAEAKNHLSALIARVEQGEEIAITRRGVTVARLVPTAASGEAASERRRQVSAALARLQQLRQGLALEGDLRAIARQGLD
jgi:prevent-host-death family protein